MGETSQSVGFGFRFPPPATLELGLLSVYCDRLWAGPVGLLDGCGFLCPGRASLLCSVCQPISFLSA